LRQVTLISHSPSFFCVLVFSTCPAGDEHIEPWPLSWSPTQPTSPAHSQMRRAGNRKKQTCSEMMYFFFPMAQLDSIPVEAPSKEGQRIGGAKNLTLGKSSFQLAGCTCGGFQRVAEMDADQKKALDPNIRYDRQLRLWSVLLSLPLLPCSLATKESPRADLPCVVFFFAVPRFARLSSGSEQRSTTITPGTQPRQYH
jgi:hypothetical protein